MEETDHLVPENQEIKDNHQKMKEANDYLERIIQEFGIRKYQVIVFIIALAFPFMDSSEILNISFLAYLTQNVVWNLSISQTTFITQMLFLASTVGLLLSLIIGDRFGRKHSIIAGLFLAILFSIFSRFAETYISFTFFRALYITSLAFTSSYGYSTFIETSPKNLRGRISILLFSMAYSMGEIITILLARSLNITEPGSDNWRDLLLWPVLPASISLLLAVFYLKETPRYMLLRDTEEGIKIVKEIYESENNGQSQISEKEIEILSVFKYSQEKTSSLSSLFSKGYRRVTICLVIIWFAMNFVYAGIPFVLSISNQESENKGINYPALLASALGEFPANIVALCIIEDPKFGRKNTILLMLCLSSVLSFLLYFVQSYSLVLIFLIKFFFSIHSVVLPPYTAELYPTNMRVRGLSVVSISCKLAAIAVSSLFLSFEELRSELAFVAFGLAMMLSLLATSILPKDTTGINLDEEIKINEKEENFNSTKGD